MTTMREKLCRAACLADGLDPDRKYSSSSDHSANAPYEFAWQEYGQQIDAILDTLRAPDDALIEIGDRAMYVGLTEVMPEPRNVGNAFTAMIDHVRKG